jgi:hypothetical protein
MDSYLSHRPEEPQSYRDLAIALMKRKAKGDIQKYVHYVLSYLFFKIIFVLKLHLITKGINIIY